MSNFFKKAYWLNLCFLIVVVCFFWGWLDSRGVLGSGGVVYRTNLYLTSYLNQKAYDPTTDLNPISDKKTGVVVDKKYGSENTLTLYAQTHMLQADLIDGMGGKVHQWKTTKEALWHALGDKAPIYAKNPSHFMALHLCPDGSLLAVVVNANHTPWGGPLIKLDRNGSIVWALAAHCHHAVSVAPDGAIYVLTHRVHKPKHKGVGPWVKVAAHYKKGLPYLDDQLTVLDANGHVKHVFSIFDELRSSPFVNKLVVAVEGRAKRSLNIDQAWDPLHASGLHVVDAKTARAWSGVEVGDAVIALRYISAFIVLSPQTGKVRRVILPGPWYMPIDGTLLPSGRLAVFDNLGKWPRSRLLLFDEQSQQIQWAYEGDMALPGSALATSQYGAMQHLKHGGWLLTDSEAARIIEVDHMGHVIWMFRNPEQTKIGDAVYQPWILDAKQFSRSSLPFLF